MTNLAAPIGAVTTPTAAPDRLDMKRVQLAHGNIAPGSSLLVELIKTVARDAHPTVLVTWPRVSEVSPARFAEVVSNACRLLGNASTELARRRIVPEQP